MNTDHQLYIALQAAPEGSQSEIVNYLADAVGTTWSRANSWYTDFLKNQDDWKPQTVLSADPMEDAELKNFGLAEEMRRDEPPLDRLQRLSQEFDAINPSHYTSGNIECIDAILEALGDEQFKGFLRGNALKYLWRAERKGSPLENCQKAEWYIKRLIAEYELEEETRSDLGDF